MRHWGGPTACRIWLRVLSILFKSAVLLRVASSAVTCESVMAAFRIRLMLARAKFRVLFTWVMSAVLLVVASTVKVG